MASEGAAPATDVAAAPPAAAAAPVTPTAAAAAAEPAAPAPIVLAAVTSLAVTYLAVPPSDAYHRFGRTSTPSYLWLDRTPGPEPINGVSVQWGTVVPAGEGWTRVDGDLNNGTTTPDKAVYLYIKRGGAESPLVDLKVVTSDDPVVGPGFAKLEEILNPQAIPIKDSIKEFLCFKTVASQAKAEAAEFAVGDVIDARDSSNNWCVAQLMKADEEGKFLVHYKGWSEKWDEWIEKTSKRLAPYRSKTLGKATGWEGDKDAFTMPSKDRAGDILNTMKKFDALDARLESKDAKERELSKDEFLFLTANEAYKLVLNCLNAIVDDVDMLPVVHSYLQKSLRHFIRSVRRDSDPPQSYLESMIKIFKGDAQYTRFYSKYGVKGSETIVGGTFCVRPATGVVTGEDRTILSSYLVENVNYFGEQGGFEAVADRLNGTTFDDSFFTIALLIKFLAVSRGLLVAEYATQLIGGVKLQELLQSRIRKITDQELKTLNKDAINDMVRDVESLLPKGAATSEFIEKMNLEISLRLLNAKVLEKRLNGCAELEETIKKVIRKERGEAAAAAAIAAPVAPAAVAPIVGPLPLPAAGAAGAAGAAAAAPGPSAKFLTQEYLIKWIDDNKVVDIFLGPSSHEQIIKRSPGLLKFLASNGALTVDHVEQLWNCSFGKHETLVRIVYDTLAALAEELSDTQLDSLFTRITAVPFSDYTDFVLSFIKNFTINAVKGQKDGATKWYGLDLFWQMIQDDVKVNPAVATQSATMLKELLEQNTFEKQRAVYLEKCMIGLREGKSVVQCLRVAQTIINMYPAPKAADKKVADDYSWEDLIAALETKYGLLQLFVTDLKRYNTVTRQQLTEFKGDTKDPILVGRFPHSLQVNARLDFLNFIVIRSPLVVSTEAVGVLWDVFVTNPVVAEDKDRLLEWFTQLVDERQRYLPAFADETAKIVFTNYLCDAKSVNYATLSAKGYEAFETYFCFINNLDGCLSTQSRRYIAVLDFAKLVGVTSLWNMAAVVLDAEVSSSAKKFLTTCYLRLDSKYSPDDKKAVFKSYIEQSMTALSVAGKQLAAKADIVNQKRVVQSFLELIENFLARCEAGETIEKPKYVENEAVRAVWKGGTRVYDARILSVNKDATYVVRYADGDMDRACPESSIMPLVAKPEEKKPDDETISYPKTVLSNDPSYFTLLFELLETSGELAPRVWKLLYRLPTNAELSAKLRNLSARNAEGKINWDELLPSRSAIKLLYSLQIVDQYLSAPIPDGEGSEQSKKEISDWCQVFLTQGGFKHLYTTLAASDEKTLLTEGPLTQQCMSLMLKLALAFLSGTPTGTDPALAHSEIDHAKLITRLTGVWAACVEAKYEAPAAQAAANKTASAAAAAASRALTVAAGGEGSIPPAPDMMDDDFDAMSMIGPQLPTAAEAAANAATAAAAPGGAAGAAVAPVSNEPPADDIFSNLIVASGLLIQNILTTKPELLAALYAFGGWKQLLTAGLLKNGNPHVRRFLTFQLLQISVKFNKIETGRPPRTFFLPLLLELLPTLDGVSQSTDYFTAVTALLRASKVEDGSFNPETLGPLLVSKLISHPLVEKRFEDVDYVLVGLLSLLKELVSRVPSLKETLGSGKGLINELKDCLFDVPKTTGRGAKVVPPPKCKSLRSRKAAYALLSELCQGCDANRTTVMAHLQGNHVTSHSGGRAPHDWQFESKSEEKASSGYVGLKNLGCICYMNALMQQLYMVPKLRQNLLQIDCDILKEEKKESVTFQLQQIMALLQESEKQYANPEGFCYAFKDFDGKPTNVSIQEDAAGFFSRLIDKIDETLKSTPYLHAFREVLGGTLSHELIGKGCPHYKERPEEFYAVTLQVQNKKTMQDSLKAFVEGEMLEGDNAFRCSQCNKKVDTFKRQSFKKLPPTICFVLKRFELDYQTMQTTKLNDKLEFPVELDLKPFCKESLGLPPRDPAMLAAFAAQEAAAAAAAPPPAAGATTPAAAAAAPVAAEKVEEDEKHDDAYYKYVLRGVVVHTGGASHGHYYSFIQERLDNPNQVGRWYEFNDTIVRDFKPEAIGSECFGGKETRGGGNSRYAGMGSTSNAVQGPDSGYDKARSGYMLFYDRVPIAGTPATATSAMVAAVPAALTAVTAAPSTVVAATPAAAAAAPSTTLATPKIFTSIWDQNLTYWRDKAVFDGGYFDFLWEVFGGDEKDAVPNFGVTELKEGEVAKPHSGPVKAEAGDHIKLASTFVLNTLTRAFHKEKLVPWLEYLRRLYTGNVNASAWLLQQFVNTRWNKEFLLACADAEVRNQVSGFICLLLQQVTPYEQASYALPLPEKKEAKSTDGSDVVADTRGFCVRYIDQIASFLRLAPDYWKTYDPFFRVLAHFASLGLAETQYLEKHNYTARLVDFFLGDESPNPAVGDMEVNDKGKRRAMGDNWTGPDTTNFLIALRYLICSTLPESCVADSKLPTPPTLSKHLTVPNVAMTPVAVSMVMSKQFLPRLILDATTRRRGRSIGDILTHQTWENERVLNQVISIVFAGMENNSYDAQRSYFRVLQSLVAIKDSLAAKRIDLVLTSLLNVMKVQAKFWKITDLCIEHLIRLAKKNAECLAWLQARPTSYDWCITWLNTNSKPPRGYDATEATILHKPGKGPAEVSAYAQHSAAQSFPTHVGLAPASKVAVLEAIKAGQPLDNEACTDSNVDLQDREFEVGQWVDCMDTAHQWLCGQVVQVAPHKIFIHYDGWSDKWNAWHPKASPNIQAFGRFTTPEQHKMRGKKKEQ